MNAGEAVMHIKSQAVALIVVSSLFVTGPCPGIAADARISTVRAEEVGMSAERLGRVKAAMQRYVERGEVPGVVTLIARRGRVVHFESIGFRDVESRTPMTPDTIFRIASMTKPIVAAALMTLYEEGEFQLSDPVSRWLPEFKSMKVVVPQGGDGNYNMVDARNPITVRHIMTHTSGVQSGGGLLAAQYTKVGPRTVPNDTLANFVTRLGALPVNFEPGTKWEYGASGNGIALTGRLVEIISKKPLDRFIEERIFRPLRMNDTYFHLPEEKLGRFAVLYKPGTDKRIEIAEMPDRNSPFVRDRSFVSGTGGLVSTVPDYLRFQLMMLNGGELDGVRILGRKTVELISANHIGNLPVASRGAGYGFGLAVSVVTDVGASGQLGSTGTYGWGGATCTITFVDPAEEIIGIMMTQVRPCTDLNIRRDFQTLAYQAIVGSARTARAPN
jgi:CubicO group peptidase (beta-lactamase class C family)